MKKKVFIILNNTILVFWTIIQNIKYNFSSFSKIVELLPTSSNII